MNAEKFKSLYKEFRDKEDELFGTKAGEYASNKDRLWNFHVQGEFQGIRPAVVCLTHFLKHITAIRKAVMDGTGEWAWETDNGSEGLKQRFADARNYLLLLGALVDEEQQKKETLKKAINLFGAEPVERDCGCPKTCDCGSES